MVQQAPPAAGTVIDGYRFKGGDPKQESSWEQVAPIDVSAQYGAGARQLPNGVIERVGPRGGVERIGSANGGDQGGASSLVGADARARFMINLGPLQQAQANLERMDGQGYNLDQDWGAAALEAIPWDGGFAARKVGGEDYNAYTQAAKTFEAAIMPIMSGAAVTPSEAQRLIRAALPQPGDSAEVLAQKSLQRRQMINAVAQGIGETAPYEVDLSGLDPAASAPPAAPAAPTDPKAPIAYDPARPLTPKAGGVAMAVGDAVMDSPEVIERNGQKFYAIGRGGQGAPANINARFGQDNEITDEEMTSAGYTYDHDTGLWLTPANPVTLGPDAGTPSSGGGAIFGDKRAEGGIAGLIAGEGGPGGGSGGGGGGPNGGGWNPTTDARGYFGGLGGKAAFDRSIMEQIPFADEAVAGVQALFTGEDYSKVREAQRYLAEYDRENNGAQRNLGGVAGATAVAATPFGAPVRATRGLTLGGRVVNRALGGAAAGGLWGAGADNGNALERVDGALGGAAIGAAGGVVAPPLANALGRAAAPLVAPLANSGRAIARPVVNALGAHAPAALREAVAVPTPLQTGIGKFSNASPQNLGDMAGRGNALMAETIQPTFVDLVNDGGRGTLRAAATRQTPGRDAAREFAESRVESLPGRLSTQARRIVSDDARPVQQIVDDLTEGRATQARTTYAEPYAQTVPIDAVTAEAMSGAPGRAALTRARSAAEAFNDTAAMQEIDALASGQTNEVSAATLDRIRQAMSGRAERLAQNPATRAVGAGVAQRAGIVDEALDSVPGLAPARDAYRQASQQIEATEAGGRFLQSNPDDMAAAVQGMAPDQMEPVRAAVARNIEITARQPGSAPGVARRLYADNEIVRPGGVGEAVLGPDAQRLGQAARMEALAVRNAIEVNPRAGSPTNLNQQDTLGAAGEVLGAVRDVATNNWLNLAPRAYRALTGNGINDREAAAILEVAVDPARTQEVVDMLSRHMSRRQARNLARAVRYQLTTGPQSGQQG